VAAADPAGLEAHDLAVHRGGRRVVEGVGFCLRHGEALVLRGANGSGKSTLLRALAGLLRPTQGEIRWDGRPVGDDPAAHRARVHYVAHADAVKGGLTVQENLAFTAALGERRGNLGSALEGMRLTALADLPAQFLSAGQRRRLALARLLASPRPLWLLDEPGVGLDRASRGRLEAVIADHRRAGGLVVVATHGDVAVPDAARLELGD
jgi:heme exporter protein A